MALAEDFLIFEAVDVDNRPVADLARAEKVLVTKLYGTLMPLIRYELTDSLIIDAGQTRMRRAAAGFAKLRAARMLGLSIPPIFEFIR